MTAAEKVIADYIHIMTGKRPSDVSQLLPEDKAHSLLIAFSSLSTENTRLLNLVHYTNGTDTLDSDERTIKVGTDNSDLSGTCTLALTMKYANEAGGFDMGNSFICVFAPMEHGRPILLGIPNPDLNDYDKHTQVYPL